MYEMSIIGKSIGTVSGLMVTSDSGAWGGCGVTSGHSVAYRAFCRELMKMF